MEKINLVELLKDCPRYIELDCSLFNNPVKYDGLDDNDVYPIKILAKNDAPFSLTKEGYLYDIPNSKCVIFPKGKTTWEGFHRSFKPGDIVINDHNEHAFIYSGENDNYWECYCGVYCGTRHLRINSKEWSDKQHKLRLATEEEKEKLFQVIKDNGYHWNAETKTLEKLVKLEFEIDDWVVFNNHPEKGSIYQIKNVHNYEYTLQHILGGSMAIPFSRVDMLKLWTIDDAKDGDVLVDKDNNIGIFQKFEGIYWYSYIYLGCDGKLRGFSIGGSHKQTDVHPATKEQRDLLFQKIKEAGYCWNDKTKTLEKLIIPKFKGGNKIRSKNKKDECFYILHVDEDKHKYVLNIKGYCLEFKDQDHYELVSDTSIEPKFKVGDKVRYKNNHNVVFTITSIEEDSYVCGSTTAFWFDDQDDYELLPNKLVKPKFKVGDRIRQKGETSTFTITDVNDVYYFCGTYIICDTWDDDWELVTDKFDITTLKPFDKVLVRDSEEGRWDITFYECYDSKNKSYPYSTLGGTVYKQCIPYKDNEHLTGIIKDCSDYYKTWLNEEN